MLSIHNYTCVTTKNSIGYDDYYPDESNSNPCRYADRLDLQNELHCQLPAGRRHIGQEERAKLRCVLQSSTNLLSWNLGADSHHEKITN